VYIKHIKYFLSLIKNPENSQKRLFAWSNENDALAIMKLIIILANDYILAKYANRQESE